MKAKNISLIAKKINLSRKDVLLYGNYKAKVIKKPNLNHRGKLVLITAMTPTKFGEGKTTTAISLVDALNFLNRNAILNLREPSLGPYFGLKGGATGGGKNSIEPDEDINLHFNGDFHAITSTNNLIASCIDNVLYWGNSLDLDPSTIKFKRCIDMNDRNLREIDININKAIPSRHTGFVITAASELMAVFCLAKDKDDFIEKVNNIIVGYSYSKKEITVRDLNISGAISKLMKDALYPNLVQTGYNNPCIIHGGPFANIACGCNSIISLKTSLSLADIVVTEAGFGADLGAEKFLDIISQECDLKPSVAVLVVSIRALKLHGGQEFDDLNIKNVEALEKGSANLFKHYESLSKFNLPIVIAINHFDSDDEEEIRTLEKLLRERNIKFAFLDGFIKGGAGAIDLANKVLEVLDTKEKDIEYIYDLNDSIENKINNIAKEIYGAKDVKFSDLALEKIEEIKKLNASNYYICMAKTPNSLSDDPKLLNVPKDFTLNVKDIYVSNGAKFIVVLTGNVLTMPGLPKNPRAVNF